jgi:hypothetical protein
LPWRLVMAGPSRKNERRIAVRNVIAGHIRFIERTFGIVA